MAEQLSPRARKIVAVARDLLEHEGPDAVTMRTIADRLGVRAPSIYKHLPHKAAVEGAIIAQGFEEAADAFEAAVDGASDPLAAFVSAYRLFASTHPHVYRLMTSGPLPRDSVPVELESRTAAPLVAAVGTPERARAAFAFIHGLVTLELDGRVPRDGMTEQAWAAGVALFKS